MESFDRRSFDEDVEKLRAAAKRYGLDIVNIFKDREVKSDAAAPEVDLRKPLSLAASFVKVGSVINLVDFNGAVAKITVTAIDNVGVYGDEDAVAGTNPRQHVLYPWTTIHHAAQRY